MYHCKTCRQEFDYDLNPFDLKVALNPDLEQNGEWTDRDWDRSIGDCPNPECYGVLEPGMLPIEINMCLDGDYNFVSESLAIHPDQAKAHRKLFPGIDIHADGKLEFHSVKSRESYCKETGFEKIPQKIKPKGTRVA